MSALSLSGIVSSNFLFRAFCHLSICGIGISSSLLWLTDLVNQYPPALQMSLLLMWELQEHMQLTLACHLHKCSCLCIGSFRSMFHFVIICCDLKCIITATRWKDTTKNFSIHFMINWLVDYWDLHLSTIEISPNFFVPQKPKPGKT